MVTEERDWKLKLRLGKRETEYSHFTAIADGIAGDLKDGFECPKDNAFMSMKTWAIDSDQSADMIKVIGSQIGFEVTGDIEIYDTEPEEPPSENPRGYDIKFTPYESE